MFVSGKPFQPSQMFVGKARSLPRVEPRVGSGVSKIVNKIISLTIMNLITPKAGAEHELLFNEPASGHIRFDLVQFLVKLIIIL